MGESIGEGKKPLGRPRRRWEDNIKMNLQEMRCGCMDLIELAQDREKWRALMTAVMNLVFHTMRGISCLAENLLASHKGLCSKE
jgi:hypothetical protein